MDSNDWMNKRGGRTGSLAACIPACESRALRTMFLDEWSEIHPARRSLFTLASSVLRRTYLPSEAVSEMTMVRFCAADYVTPWYPLSQSTIIVSAGCLPIPPIWGHLDAALAGRDQSALSFVRCKDHRAADQAENRSLRPFILFSQSSWGTPCRRRRYLRDCPRPKKPRARQLMVDAAKSETSSQ